MDDSKLANLSVCHIDLVPSKGGRNHKRQDAYSYNSAFPLQWSSRPTSSKGTHSKNPSEAKGTSTTSSHLYRGNIGSVSSRQPSGSKRSKPSTSSKIGSKQKGAIVLNYPSARYNSKSSENSVQKKTLAQLLGKKSKYDEEKHKKLLQEPKLLFSKKEAGKVKGSKRFKTTLKAHPSKPEEVYEKTLVKYQTNRDLMPFSQPITPHVVSPPSSQLGGNEYSSHEVVQVKTPHSRPMEQVNHFSFLEKQPQPEEQPYLQENIGSPEHSEKSISQKTMNHLRNQLSSHSHFKREQQSEERKTPRSIGSQRDSSSSPGSHLPRSIPRNFGAETIPRSPDDFRELSSPNNERKLPLALPQTGVTFRGMPSSKPPRPGLSALSVGQSSLFCCTRASQHPASDCIVQQPQPKASQHRRGGSSGLLEPQKLRMSQQLRPKSKSQWKPSSLLRSQAMINNIVRQHEKNSSKLAYRNESSSLVTSPTQEVVCLTQNLRESNIYQEMVPTRPFDPATDGKEMVWYAAYDVNVCPDSFENTLRLIGELNTAPRNLSIIIPGYELCFDTAISDFPYLRPFKEPSPYTLKDRPLAHDEVVDKAYARMYLIKKQTLVDLLQQKAVTEVEDLKHLPEFETQIDTAGKDVFLKQVVPSKVATKMGWFKETDPEVEVPTYPGVESTSSDEDLDDLSRIERLIGQNLAYQNYNCLKVVGQHEGSKIYILTNNQLVSPFVYRNFLTADEEFQKKCLERVIKFQLFSRIRWRAGCPTQEVKQRIEKTHQELLAKICKGLADAFSNSEASSLRQSLIPFSEAGFSNYLKGCHGVKWVQSKQAVLSNEKSEHQESALRDSSSLATIKNPKKRRVKSNIFAPADGETPSTSEKIKQLILKSTTKLDSAALLCSSASRRGNDSPNTVDFDEMQREAAYPKPFTDHDVQFQEAKLPISAEQQEKEDTTEHEVGQELITGQTGYSKVDFDISSSGHKSLAETVNRSQCSNQQSTVEKHQIVQYEQEATPSGSIGGTDFKSGGEVPTSNPVLIAPDFRVPFQMRDGLPMGGKRRPSRRSSSRHSQQNQRIETRSSQQAQDQRKEIINNLLDDTAGFSQQFEERNFPQGDDEADFLKELQKSLVNSLMEGDQVKVVGVVKEKDEENYVLSLGNQSDKLFVLKRFNDSLLHTISKGSSSVFNLDNQRTEQKPKPSFDGSFVHRFSLIPDQKSKEGSSFKQNVHDIVQMLAAKDNQYWQSIQPHEGAASFDLKPNLPPTSSVVHYSSVGGTGGDRDRESFGSLERRVKQFQDDLATDALREGENLSSGDQRKLQYETLFQNLESVLHNLKQQYKQEFSKNPQVPQISDATRSRVVTQEYLATQPEGNSRRGSSLSQHSPIRRISEPRERKRGAILLETNELKEESCSSSARSYNY